MSPGYFQVTYCNRRKTIGMKRILINRALQIAIRHLRDWQPILRVSPRLARTGHADRIERCPVLGVERKHLLAVSISGFDSPYRKSAPGNGAPDRVPMPGHPRSARSDSHRTGGPDSSRSKDRFETTYSISPRVMPISMSSQSFRRYNSARSLCRLRRSLRRS